MGRKRPAESEVANETVDAVSTPEIADAPPAGRPMTTGSRTVSFPIDVTQAHLLGLLALLKTTWPNLSLRNVTAASLNNHLKPHIDQALGELLTIGEPIYAANQDAIDQLADMQRQRNETLRVQNAQIKDLEQQIAETTDASLGDGPEEKPPNE